MNEEARHPVGSDALHRHAMHCANCGGELEGPFCAHCGQPVRTFIRALWGLVYEMLDEFVSFDSRAFRTFPALLFRPGFLTNEYLAGRRARYVQPLRLYLLISILFFLIVTVFGLDDAQFADGLQIELEDNTQATVSSLEKALHHLERTVENEPEESRARTRSAIEALRAELEATRARAAAENPEPALEDEVAERSIFDWDEERLARYAKTQGQRVASNPQRFMDKLFGAMPQTMFLLLPLFALLLKFFYLFRKRFYTEHLIVALHSHSFMFLAFLLIFLISAGTDALAGAWEGGAAPVRRLGTWLSIGIGVWIPVYLFLMQKRVYQQGWFMTFLKFGLIGLAYITLLSLALVAAVLIGFVTT